MLLTSWPDPHNVNIWRVGPSVKDGPRLIYWPDPQQCNTLRVGPSVKDEAPPLSTGPTLNNEHSEGRAKCQKGSPALSTGPTLKS